LNVIREQTLSLETRVAAAREALPYFHSKPQESAARQATPGRYGNASFNGNSGQTGQQSINIKIFKGGSAPEESDRETGEQKTGSDEVQKRHPKALPDTSMTPLKFLLGAMRDPDTPTNLRFRIASLLVPYVHPRHTADGPRKIVVDDPTGFTVDPASAIELRDAKRRYDFLYRTSFTEPEQYKREAPGLRARIHAIEKTLECACPSLYGENELNRDEERLEGLSRVRQSGRKLSAHEDIEEAWLTARVASWSTVPEWAARARLHQLDARRWDDRWNHGPPLTVREQAEFRALQTVYPQLPVEKTIPEGIPGEARNGAARMMRGIREMRVAVKFQRS